MPTQRCNRGFGLPIRQFVVGTGGSSAGPPDPEADKGFRGYGVLKLDLHAGNYGWSFIDVGVNGFGHGPLPVVIPWKRGTSNCRVIERAPSALAG